LNAVTPLDWAAFLRTRLDATSPHANLAGIENGGWRLVYTDAPNLVRKANEAVGKTIDLTASGGLVVGEDGRVGDVAHGSPAERAGLSPGMSIVAVNGRKYSHDVMRDALAAAKSGPAIQLIVQHGEYFRTTALDYHDGLRSPHLVRDPSKPDVLGQIMAPLAAGARSGR
jgi:predicted metalloprotease with PDZ domain